MAKITIPQLEIAVNTFVQETVIPAIPPVTIYPFGQTLPITINSTIIQFLGGVGTVYGGIKLEQAVPFLKGIGIIEEDNKIDIDKFVDVMKEQITKVGGNLEIASFRFTVEDVERIRELATQQGISI